MIEEGSQVPKFQLEDANGKLVKSSDFKGKKHVIYFYPRDLHLGVQPRLMNSQKTIQNSKKQELKSLELVKMMFPHIGNSVIK